MGMEASKFKGWCPVVIGDRVVLTDWSEGIVEKIRTIQEISGPERQQKVWFEIYLDSGKWVPLSVIATQSWTDEKGNRQMRDLRDAPAWTETDFRKG